MSKIFEATQDKKLTELTFLDMERTIEQIKKEQKAEAASKHFFNPKVVGRNIPDHVSDYMLDNR